MVPPAAAHRWYGCPVSFSFLVITSYVRINGLLVKRIPEVLDVLRWLALAVDRLEVLVLVPGADVLEEGVAVGGGGPVLAQLGVIGQSLLHVFYHLVLMIAVLLIEGRLEDLAWYSFFCFLELCSIVFSIIGVAVLVPASLLISWVSRFGRVVTSSQWTEVQAI